MAILKKRQSKTEPVAAPTRVAKQTTDESPAKKLTSTIKSTTGTQTDTGSKPTVSAPVGTAKPTMTTKLTGEARPSVEIKKGNANTSAGKALTGAVTGALAAAGSKYIYDKATGKLKPTTPAKPKAPTTGPKAPTAPGKSQSSGVGINLPSGSKAPPKAPPKAPAKPSAPGSAKKPTAPKIAGAVTEIANTAGEGEEGFGWKYYSDGTVIDPDGNYYRNGKMIWSPQTTEIENTAEEGDEAFGWQYFSDGTVIDPDGNYYKDGKMIWSPDEGDVTYEIENTAQEGDEAFGWQYFSDGTAIDPDGNYYQNGELIYSANPDGSFDKAGDEGTFTYVDEEGYTMVYDANDNIISYDNPDYLAAQSGGSGGESIDYGDGVTGNSDGTFTYVDENGYTMVFDENGIISYDAPGYNADTGEMDVGGDSDEGYYTGADGESYYIDSSGNYYDGEGNLIWSPDSDYGDGDWTQDAIDNYEYTDEYGNKYDFYGNLTYENTDYFDPDYVYTDDLGFQYDYNGNIIYDPFDDNPTWMDDYEDDYPIYDYGDEEEWPIYDYGDDESWPIYDYKRGGFVTMMKDGGVPKYADGGDVEYFDDGSYIVYNDDGSFDTYDTEGNLYRAEEDERFSDDYDYSNIYDYGEPEGEDDFTTEIDNPAGEGEEGYGWRYFSDGTVISPDGEYYQNGELVYDPNEGGIFSPGGVKDIYTKVTSSQTAKDALDWAKRQVSQGDAIDTVMDAISGSGYLGAGAAGAVLGALLGNSDLFSGSSDTNQGIDMRKVGVIPPRTTDFGIGSPRYVTYGEYGARDQMPEIYGNELYKNLNAPGFNPVNEGDYGYEETPAQTPQAPQTPAPAQAMADGGLAGSYYTFGKAVDPLQNLTNPRPMAPQMGGLQASAPMPPQASAMAPQQAPMQMNPQQAQMPQMPRMPQQAQMPPGMKRGGLPAMSDVPMVEGRLDFRKGAPVHGPGDGQSDDIPAMLADGEYVFDAETVAQIGNGSTKAGAQALDQFRKNIRKHKRSAPLDKIPPKTKALTSYLKKGK